MQTAHGERQVYCLKGSGGRGWRVEEVGDEVEEKEEKFRGAENYLRMDVLPNVADARVPGSALIALTLGLQSIT
jgi:hypothetical protein